MKTTLSPCETKVLELIASGMENKQIAHNMGWSINVAESYTKRIYEKLEVNCRVQAVVKGIQIGLVKI